MRALGRSQHARTTMRPWSRCIWHAWYGDERPRSTLVWSETKVCQNLLSSLREESQCRLREGRGSRLSEGRGRGSAQPRPHHGEPVVSGRR
jgi:hypothetical protein